MFLRFILKLANLERRMSVVDDAVAKLASDMVAHDAAVQAEIAALKAAIAANDPVAQQALADKISAASAQVAAETAALAASVAPAAPAPAPAAPAAPTA